MLLPTTLKESTALHPVSLARPAGMYCGVITVSVFVEVIGNPVAFQRNDRVKKI
jgi:hypothetical protein